MEAILEAVTRTTKGKNAARRLRAMLARVRVLG